MIVVKQVAFIVLAFAATMAGCSSNLRELRTRPPEFQFPGIAASGQFGAARCIRDVFEGVVGSVPIVQRIEQDDDGMHVIGRLDESLSGPVFDVAIRQDAVVARLAPAWTMLRDTLRYSIAACVGENEKQP